MESRFKFLDEYMPEKKQLQSYVVFENGESRTVSYQITSEKPFNSDTLDVFFEEFYSRGEHVVLQVTYHSPEFGDMALPITERELMKWMSESDADGITRTSLRFLPNEFMRNDFIESLKTAGITGSWIGLNKGDPTEFIDIGEVSKAGIIKFNFPKNAAFAISEFPVTFPAADGLPEHAQPGYLVSLDIIKDYDGDVVGNEEHTVIRVAIGGPHSIFNEEERTSAEPIELHPEAPKSEVKLLTDDDLTFVGMNDIPEDTESEEYRAFQEKWFETANKNMRWKAIFGTDSYLVKNLLERYTTTLFTEEELTKNPDEVLSVQVKLDEFEAWIKAEYPDSWPKFEDIIALEAVEIMQSESLTMIPNLKMVLMDKDVIEKVRKLSALNAAQAKLTVDLTNKYASQILSKDEAVVKEALENYKNEFMVEENSATLKAKLEELALFLCEKCGFVAPEGKDIKESAEYGMIYLTIPAIMKNQEALDKLEEKEKMNK